jgi:hypothetical protein
VGEALVGERARPRAFATGARNAFHIAYRQPITRGDGAVRGVSIGWRVANAPGTRLIEQVGGGSDWPSKTYAPRHLFLKYFGLKNLEEFARRRRSTAHPHPQPESLLTVDPDWPPHRPTTGDRAHRRGGDQCAIDVVRRRRSNSASHRNPYSLRSASLFITGCVRSDGKNVLIDGAESSEQKVAHREGAWEAIAQMREQPAALSSVSTEELKQIYISYEEEHC